jgi:GNAT superfamily N-acetyltransferase
MSITVRQIELEDKTSWQELYLAYLKFYESEATAAAKELLWTRVTKHNPEIQGLLAEVNGEIAGIVHFHYQLSTWSDTYHCYLEDLFVNEDARGKGVATALIAEVKKLAMEQECSELFWITKESNTLARKLYEKVAVVSDFVRYEIKLED